jgi:hypothetical protein
MRRTALLLLVVALGLSACSDDDPPEWLVDRATSSSTTAPTTTVPTTTTTPQPGRELAAIELQVGQCIEDASAFTARQVREVSRVDAIACRLPHQAEVFLRGQVAGGRDAAFPGVRPLRQEAQGQCRQAFEPFVGVPWTRSELDIAALWPSADSWPTGDRLVVCVVFRIDGQPLERSARGSGL